MKFLRPALVLAAACVPTIALASDTPDGLRILVEDLSEQDISCGITSEGLKSTIRSSLRYNRIEELPSDAFDRERLYVTVNSISTTVGCFSNVTVEISAYGEAETTYLDFPVSGDVMLGSSAGVISSNSNSVHPRRVYEFLKEHIDTALSRIADESAAQRANLEMIEKIAEQSAYEAITATEAAPKDGGS